MAHYSPIMIDQDVLIGKQINVAIDSGRTNGVYFNNPTEGADQQVRVELAQRRAQAKVDEKLALVEQYGDDNFENGVLLKFDKLFAEGGITYQYAVLKTNNKWYSTGNIAGFQRGTWEELVLALVSGEFPVKPSEITIPNVATEITVADVSTYAS